MKYRIASIWRHCILRKKFSSYAYWNQRYESGHNSGHGSYGHLAEFKASVLNDFIRDNEIESVIEFGCGDGNQLALARYPVYTGYDISHTSLAICRKKFAGDAYKKFYHVNDYAGERADLTISLDVIFHLTEDEVFDSYMRRLFGAASRYVAIYSSNQKEPIEPVAAHVRHRFFSKWIDKNARNWRLVSYVPNPYPYNGNSEETSFSNFYFYKFCGDVSMANSRNVP